MPNLRTSRTVLCLAPCLLALSSLHAQATSHLFAKDASDDGVVPSGVTSPEAAENGPQGIIPYVKGINVSLGTTSQHDSSNGWTSILTPDVAYRFDRHFSVDATLPIYDYINVEVTGGTTQRPTYALVTKHFALADTELNGHFEVNPALLSYSLTATAGLPTGKKSFGLGAGQPTYNFLNHFEKSFGIVSPDIELGIGSSSGLEGTRIRKSYTSVGTQAYFQAGASLALPRNVNFSADAYEDLPLAAENLYSTTGRGRKKVTTAIGKSLSEDNGFLTSLDIPLNPHVTLSGFYNRSLRSRIDTAGFSFTFLLKAPKQRE